MKNKQRYFWDTYIYKQLIIVPTHPAINMSYHAYLLLVLYYYTVYLIICMCGMERFASFEGNSVDFMGLSRDAGKI